MNSVTSGLADSPLKVAMTRVRWRIFSFMFGFGLLAYMQQKSLTVAAQQMMPELGLTQMQVGWLQQPFVIGYCALQLPAGILGQRHGTHRAMIWMGILSFLAVITTPLAPVVFSGQTLFVALLGTQLLLGLAQAAVFPVSAGVFEAWFPPNRWAFVEGLQTAGLGLGAAITPPLIASLMLVFGWQAALFWTSVPALALIAGWMWYGRDRPSQHLKVTTLELAEIGEGVHAVVAAPISWTRLRALLLDQNVVLITFSYICMNYAFYLLSNWCFLYLVQERHFSVITSGLLASIPPLASAIGAGLGGAMTGQLCARFGTCWGFRLIPLIALPIAGLLLIVAVSISSPLAAVAALALCFGFVELTEGSYWGAAITFGRADSMTACGVMNTGGNLGGIIGIPIVAYLSGHGAWHTAFLIGTVCALVAAVAWLGIDARRVVGAEAT